MTGIRNPTLHTAGLAAVERAVNDALRLSPHSVVALAGLGDEVLALECTRPPLTVYLQGSSEGRLLLRGAYDGPVATRVVGAAGDFAALAQAEDPAAALINGNLQLQGSSALLMDMQRVLAEVELDWESLLVDGLGDVAGHQLAQMLRAALGWSRQAAGSLRRQLDEFAHEEARLAPPRLELEDFYADVEALSERSERLAQRVEKLRLRLERLRTASP